MRALGNDSDPFDEYDAFVPAHLPDPGPFLQAGAVLENGDHVAAHRLARDVFEARGVYDITFGYNLATLNLDPRHPAAGFRYAEADRGSELRAEFTPTTSFCPAGNSLAIGAFRAFNGCDDRHEYDVVRVRVTAMHNKSDSLNEELARLEAAYERTGTVPDAATVGEHQ